MVFVEPLVGFLGYVCLLVVLEPLEAFLVKGAIIVVQVVPVELQQILMMEGAMGVSEGLVGKTCLPPAFTAVAVEVLEGIATMAAQEEVV
jgi:hypothetical protein